MRTDIGITFNVCCGTFVDVLGFKLLAQHAAAIPVVVVVVLILGVSCPVIFRHPPLVIDAPFHLCGERPFFGVDLQFRFEFSHLPCTLGFIFAAEFHSHGEDLAFIGEISPVADFPPLAVKVRIIHGAQDGAELIPVVALGGIVGGYGTGAIHDLGVKSFIGELHRTGFRHKCGIRPGIGENGDTGAVDPGHQLFVRLFPRIIVDKIRIPGGFVFKFHQIPPQSIVDTVEPVVFGCLLSGGKSDEGTDKTDSCLHLGQKVHS